MNETPSISLSVKVQDHDKPSVNISGVGQSYSLSEFTFRVADAIITGLRYRIPCNCFISAALYRN